MLRLFTLMCFALAAAFASAQPVASGRPAVVDSQQECKSLGGAWVAQGTGGWQFACQAPWARDECLRLGGAWSPLSAAPAGGICMAQVSTFATARQCTQAGGAWGPPGSTMPFCTPGTGRPAVALRKASDAGKACDSQTDCSYGCVYEGPPAAEGADVLGRCRATNKASGCYSMVEKGRLSGRICVN